MKKTKLLGALCASVTLLSIATPTNAAMITQFGDDVKFEYDNATAYGIGTVTGNAIFFTPTTILAESTDDGGLATFHATINIDVTATTTGFSMASFTLLESGDYQLDGGTDVGGGASVDAQGFFQVSSNTSITGCPGPTDLCQGTATYGVGALPDTADVATTWDMGGTINLGDTTGWGSDTSVNLTIQNNLSAETTALGEHAFIQKKFSVSIPQVPVPAAVWLFGSGLIGLIGIARRKKV